MAETPKEPQIPPKLKSSGRSNAAVDRLSAPPIIVMIAFDGCQTLDVNGPWEVFAQASKYAQQKRSRPCYDLVLASPHGGEITTSSGIRLASTRPLSSLTRRIDTVIVAGGDRDRIDALTANEELLQWLRHRVRSVRRIASVCTGVFALAAAGLLDGRRATTHWESCARLKAMYPAIAVEPDAIFVIDPPFYSSAGITAGLDLALALVEADHGRKAALEVARELVVYLRRPGGQSQFSAGLRAQAEAGERMRDLVAWMADHLTTDLRIPSLATRAGMSERSFARTFRADTGHTPARVVEALRVERARTYLEETDWPLVRVSERCGFGSVDGLARAMLRQVGITPLQYRERFSRPNEPGRADAEQAASASFQQFLGTHVRSRS